MDGLNQIIANLIAIGGGGNVDAATKQLCAVADAIGSPFDPATAGDGTPAAEQLPLIKCFLEGTLITDPIAKNALAEAYALIVTETQAIPS